MKKLLIALLLGLTVPSLSFADATWTSTKNGRAVTGQQGISNVVAVADGSTGYTTRVDSTGALQTIEKPCTVGTASGVDTLIYTGASRVYSMSAAAPTAAAGDHVEIYDALSATGTPKFEISIGTAKDTKQILIPQGAKFTTGIFADQTGGSLLTTVCYDT